MSGITPYLLFPGNAEEALRFYRSVFGGELSLRTFREFGRADGPSDAIAHGVLTGPVTLFAADAGPDEDAVHLTGVFLALLGTEEPAILHGWFDALGAGGRVLEPLVPRAWGAADGRLIDRYGVRWLLGYEGAEAAGTDDGAREA